MVHSRTALRGSICIPSKPAALLSGCVHHKHLLLEVSCVLQQCTYFYMELDLLSLSAGSFLAADWLHLVSHDGFAMGSSARLASLLSACIISPPLP